MPTESTMTVDEFVTKWSRAALRERANSQTHFNDLCAMLGVQTPVEGDPTGDTYRFAQYVPVTRQKRAGEADVWKSESFGWEYKSEGKSLDDAYVQLDEYRMGLRNPPLLIVSDMNRFEIHLNFVGVNDDPIIFDLEAIRAEPGKYLHILRCAFDDPDELNPLNEPEEITKTAARIFGDVAERLREEGHDPGAVARFLNRVVFCCFAESVSLFDGGRGRLQRPLQDVLFNLIDHPGDTEEMLGNLFAVMAREDRTVFGPIRIRWFNGGLFDEHAPVEVFRLTGDLAFELYDATRLNWARIDPSIFGTLFERGLDPDARRQHGQHFTRADDIMRVIEPVVLQPLRRELAELKASAQRALGSSGIGDPPTPYNGSLHLPGDEEHTVVGLIRAFHDRLADVRILDPACGSGNFLYVALRELKNFEQAFLDWATEEYGISSLRRRIGPDNLFGIDREPFAVDLTRVSIWIGQIQWAFQRGIRERPHPILGRIDQIERRDAIVDSDDNGNPIPAEWPEAEFIVGNPPFLGMKLMRQKLDNRYVDRLRSTFAEHLDGRVDLCVYWHELARSQIETGRSRRAGLLATQSITGIFSRPVLERVNESGAVFLAYSNEPWVNDDGTDVRISIICQDDGSESERVLDGKPVSRINPDLTAGVTYVASASELEENRGVAFQGDIRNGPFDLTHNQGQQMLTQPTNVNSRPNSDVVFPFVNAHDLAQRPRGSYIIDFGHQTDRKEAAMYEAPWEYAREYVKPHREMLDSEPLKTNWWLHEAWRPGMRTALSPLHRYIATPLTSKHRFYVWLEPNVIPDATVVAIARPDDYAFGVLHSRVHEVWALAQAPRLGVGNDPRYTHTQCFNTFPFPWPLNARDSGRSFAQLHQRAGIAMTAKKLSNRRESWLNPTSVNPAILQDRTMTGLYNRRPDWLDDAHEALDEAVFAAYGWPTDLTDDEILSRLLDLNRERASERP